MKKKNLNKVISLALVASFASSCVSAKEKSQRKQNNLVENLIIGGTLLTAFGIGAYKANESGLLPFGNKIPDKKQEVPDDTPAPKPQELPLIPKEKPVFSNMYQRARYALGEEGLKEYCKNWFSAYIDLTTGDDGTIYLGKQGTAVTFEDKNTVEEKSFLGRKYGNVRDTVCTYLTYFNKDKDNREEKAQAVLKEWKRQNANEDAGEKYNTLVKLIGLPVNNEEDIVQLAKVLREAKIVNEEECISIGVTTFNKKQNRICVAMYGDRYNETYKKMVTSCGKGLWFKFDYAPNTFDTGDSISSNPDYYFITPTSITR